ncbi:proline-rich receptor-like protein kinase PERK9 [Iris pallida]|uniref:Proline-rich receptor-like protein kinase PERK9 n=1 Tax=Iris pallida TaxID=29817 RepID=A0AAX6H9L1_IRIPA|nr:proline-rich receptor-like protein kinase PERK9 [Iris pallida]
MTAAIAAPILQPQSRHTQHSPQPIDTKPPTHSPPTVTTINHRLHRHTPPRPPNTKHRIERDIIERGRENLRRRSSHSRRHRHCQPSTAPQPDQPPSLGSAELDLVPPARSRHCGPDRAPPGLFFADAPIRLPSPSARSSRRAPLRRFTASAPP